MAIVERGNVVLEVSDDDIQRYIDKGFNLTDGHGHILQEAIPNDIGALQKLVVTQKNEIDELKRQIEKYKSNLVIPLQNDEIEIIDDQIEQKPKRGRRKKNS